MLRLGKYHGLGNDFLVALDAHNPGLGIDSEVARAVCDRRRGIGADGLVLGFGVAGGGEATALAEGGDLDARMVLLNADGSEAEISGNGIRCLAQAILRAGGRREGELCIGSGSGRRELRVVRGDPDGEIWIDVDMGEVTPGPSLGRTTLAWGAREAATASIGNPHLVLLVDDTAPIDPAVDGPQLESDYPGGINVHFVRVLGADHIELKVWERGAGVTDACGSGASVAAAVAEQWGLVKGRVQVDMPGGTASVEVIDGSVHLVGPSTHVGEVTVG